jgi:tripartite-type tricarboxylate transporter receptor subunit TctC
MYRDQSPPLDLNTYNRREFSVALGSFALLGALGAGKGPARAQSDYPSRPIRLVVGFSAGGSTDIIARTAAAKLSEILGQQIYIENRPGASNNLATQAVARAAKDGYTLMIGSLSNAVNESLFNDLPFNFAKDFAPVAPLAVTDNVLVASPSLEVRSVSDLIDLAKRRPGEILYGTSGKGTAPHLAAELFNLHAGTKLVPVHYRGGAEPIRDVLSGEIKVMFSTFPPVLGFIADGRLRGIATTGPSRAEALPNVPTIAESGLPGFDMRLWFGLVAPAGTPQDIIDRLAKAARTATDSPDLKAGLARQGYSALSGTPEDFGVLIRAEIDKWAKVVPAIGSLGN